MSLLTTSPWSKKVLLPFWTIQSILCIGIIVLESIGLANWATLTNSYFNTLDIAAITLISIFTFNFLLTLTQSLLYYHNRLTPASMLGLQITQNVFSTALWVFSILGAVDGDFVGLGIMTVVAVAFWGSLGYASVVFHRGRMAKRGGRYGVIGTAGVATEGVEMERGMGGGLEAVRKVPQYQAYRPYA